MAFRDRFRYLVSRLADRFPRRTVRLRLTMVYSSLFLASGAMLLFVTNVLVRRASPTGNGFIVSRQGGQAVFAYAGTIQGPPGPLSAFTANPGGSPVQVQATANQLGLKLVSDHAHLLHQLELYSWAALAVVAALSVGFGWIMAGRVLRPLRTMTAAARNISATNLHQRLALDGPDDELKDLGETFNALLGRLETAFTAQRRFVANASHELRSPLARQRTLAQVALNDPEASVDSLRVAHERVLASGAQQERLIEGLLTLARGEAGLDRRELVDLSVVTDSVLLNPAQDLDRLDLHVETEIMPATLMGDPRLVERLITNLVDNALRHNVPGGQVRVSTRMDGLRATLRVANDGPVIPPGEMGRLWQTFQRMARERTGAHGEGVGLGLSIVQAIANAHGARIRAVPPPAGGLVIEVSFPPVVGPLSVPAPSESDERDERRVETAAS